MPVREVPFGVRDYPRDVPLPLQGYTTEVWFVADLVDQVVEIAQLRDDLPDHVFLHPRENCVFQRQHVRPLHFADAVDVVPAVQRAALPHLVPVVRAEQDQFHNNTTLCRLAHEFLETLEVSGVPLGQIELSLDHSPGSDEPAG